MAVMVGEDVIPSAAVLEISSVVEVNWTPHFGGRD
jgi:hypothetical protein